MISAFGLLMASALPASLLIYLVGSIFLRSFKVAGPAIAIGYVAALVMSAVIALLIADQPTVESAMKSIAPAALIGSLIALVGVGIAGKRKRSSQDDAP